MAGAGFKTFSVGDVLTASDVNGYLMSQAVMNFASSGARGSAIGTATEGMLSYLADTDAVEVYDGSAWVGVGSEPPAGIGSNVVQTVKTDSFSSTSTTYTAVTGLSVTITPSSNTSKVLLIASVNISINHDNVNQANHFRLTGGNISTNYQGDAASNREPVAFSFGYSATNFTQTRGMVAVSAVYLDSPATTSATTYQVEGRRQGATTFVVNRTGEDPDASYAPRGASTITAIEVAA